MERQQRKRKKTKSEQMQWRHWSDKLVPPLDLLLPALDQKVETDTPLQANSLHILQMLTQTLLTSMTKTWTSKNQLRS
jgi:hypothetical protein